MITLQCSAHHDSLTTLQAKTATTANRTLVQQTAGVQVWCVSGRPAGISQRDVTQRFPELPAAVEAVEAAVLDFHEDHVMAAFPLLDCEPILASWANPDCDHLTLLFVLAFPGAHPFPCPCQAEDQL